MTRTLTALSTALLVLTLSVPEALAQASRRGGSTSGGGSGGRTVAGPGGGAQPRAARPQPAERVTAPTPRSTTSTRGSRPSASRIERGADQTPATVATAGRAPNGRYGLGTAQPRQVVVRPGGARHGYYGYPSYPAAYYPYYRPYYGYYPSAPYYAYPYGSHWGFSIGFGFGYGAAYWPYSYGPYPHYHGSYGYYGYPYTSRNYVSVHPGDTDERDREDEPVARASEVEAPALGSLRLRISPRTAQVYVDGAPAGVVDEFDGLTNHLKLPAGRHTIELRADGYEPLTIRTTVDADQTRTERASLRKQ